MASLDEIRKTRSILRDSHFTLWNKHVCSHFSIYITKLLLYTPITANQVTFIMLVLGIVGSAFLFNGFFVTGLLILHFAVVLDNVDGEIARFKKERSMMGKYLDIVYHVTVSPLMLFGYAYGIYNLHPDKLLIVFGFLAAMFSKSVILPAIFDVIVTMRIKGSHPPLKTKTDGSEIKEIEGKAERYKSHLLRIYSKAKDFWEHPFNLVALTILYIWEIYNMNYLHIPSYSATVAFFVLYGAFVTLNQTASFILHALKNSIESFDVFLFGRK
jgi:hypothetical protein